MPELIVADGLGKKFREFTAVDRIDLRVRAGEVLVILGPNGAGKTTTIRLLSTVLTPTSGSARVAGFDVVKQPDRVRQSVGVLTEHQGLYRRMAAEEYLVFFGQLYGLSLDQCRIRSRRLLDQFGLSGAGSKRLGEYSRGMRQKLALARTLLHEPSVLLLDEPTSAMDPESTRRVRDTIKGLRTADRAIILCTHNLAEAEDLADRIAILHQGKIILQGSPEEIKRSLLGPPEFLACLAEAPRAVPALPDGVDLVANGPDWLRFRIEDPNSMNPALIRALVDSGLTVVSFQEVPHRLEDAYLEVMQGSQKPAGEG